ncbi:MAG: PEP-CTERM sorting domain-containing protein [Armatimonadetes bacterium]|nr:PEP-CTERM sorting domain-containing protein [Armatimonadota bacterium]
MLRLTLLAGLALAAASSFATVFDAYNDFSISNNPNGVWRYGYSNTLGGAFVPLTVNTPGNPDAWLDPFIASLGVYHTTPGFLIGTVSSPPNQMILHPGPNAQYAVLRFVAPGTGVFNFTAGFFGVDFVGPTTTDVHILQNNAVIGNGAINTFATSPSIIFGGPVSLNTGDTLDVAVGFGGNSYLFDSTAVNYRIEGVPEPVTLVGLGGLALLARRRRR